MEKTETWRVVTSANGAIEVHVRKGTSEDYYEFFVGMCADLKTLEWALTQRPALANAPTLTETLRAIPAPPFVPALGDD